MTDIVEPLISSERVEEILVDCLFTQEEMHGEGPPENAIYVEGIINKYAFHPERLESHREEVKAMLWNLPTAFLPIHDGGGGGWTFLNACQDRNDVQWTGLHLRMEQLFCLGMALGYVKFPMPREFWSHFPGGMPYICLNDDPQPIDADG